MDYENQLIQVVNIKQASGEIYRTVKDAKFITANGKQDSYRDQLRKILSENENKQIVIIASEEEYLYSKAFLKGEMLKDVYYLFGDRRVLNEFKKEQLAINQARINGPRANQCGS